MPIPSDYSAPVVLSAKERAFRQIQEWIIDGTLKPGERINDNELAQAIGVSRTPVREALQILSINGFVTMKPGVSTTISDIDSSDITKLFPPLSMLEGLAAKLAAPIIDAKAIKRLRALNSDFSEAVHAKDGFNALKADERFHDCIVCVCDNQYLENAITPMQSHVRRLIYMRSVVLAEESADEHIQLIDALERRDASEAFRIAKKNWLRPLVHYLGQNE